MLEKIVRRIAVAGRHTYSDAGGSDDFTSVNQERMGKSGDNFLRKPKRLIQFRYVCCNHPKLVSAYARNEIRVASASTESGRQLSKEFISCRIGKDATQKHTRVRNNQNCDQQINKVAVFRDADCRPKKNGSHKANGCNRNGCKCEGATCQHPGAQCGHQHLPAGICVLKESNGN